MKTVLIILGLIIAFAGISTLAGVISVYASQGGHSNAMTGSYSPEDKAQTAAEKNVLKISAIILGISILAYVLLSKYSKK